MWWFSLSGHWFSSLTYGTWHAHISYIHGEVGPIHALSYGRECPGLSKVTAIGKQCANFRILVGLPLVRLRDSFPRLRRASSPEVPVPADKDPRPDLLAVSPSHGTGWIVVVLSVLLETLGQVVKMVRALFLFESRLCFSSSWRSHPRNWMGFIFYLSLVVVLDPWVSQYDLFVGLLGQRQLLLLDPCPWLGSGRHQGYVCDASSYGFGSRVCSSVSHSLSCGTSWPTNMSTGRCGEMPTIKWNFFPSNSRVTLDAGNQVFRELAVA